MKVCLVLTHQCNLGCSYCYAGEKFKKVMSYEDGLRGLDLAFRADGPIEVSFFGGEPMIEFQKMARLTRVAHRWAQKNQREISFAVTTNCTILQKKHLDFLKHYGFFVGLSVDGLKEEQDKSRPFIGGRGSGELVWRNLEQAAQTLSDFRVLTVVRPDTLKRLPQAMEQMYRVGVSKVSLLPDMEADWSGVSDLLQDVYGQLARVCFLSMLTDEPFWISPFVEQHPSVRSSRCGSNGKSGGCGFGRQEVAISPGGNFYPCARLVGTDRRTESRIGCLDNGFDTVKIEDLNRQATEQLSKCGSGGCKCLAVMPGDTNLQLTNVRRFVEVTDVACRAAAELTGEVVAA